jgi:GAF domain-containing protein
VAKTTELASFTVEPERRRAEAEALAELVRQGATDPDTDRVVGLVTETACRLLEADYAGVALVDADGTRSWRGVWGNRTDAWRTTARLAGRGPVAKCIAEGRTFVSEHLRENPDFPQANLTLHMSEGGLTALTTPLFSRGSTLGALVLGWRSEFSPMSDHVRLAEALAGYAATIIDNARAHDRVAARAEELRSL